MRARVLCFASIVLAAAAHAEPAELVRVRITSFDGTEPAALSKMSHPGLFTLDSAITSATLTATNPAAPAMGDGGPSRWLPALTPSPPAGTAGKIELTFTPIGTIQLGLVRFSTEALFPENPSSLVVTTSLDGFANPLQVIPTAERTRVALLPNAPPSSNPVTIRWTAGNDFGDFGGGAAGFGGEDIVVATPPCSPMPEIDCEGAEAAALSLQAGAAPKLAWSWQADEPLPPSEFGPLVDGSLVSFCLYVDGALALTALPSEGLCGKKPCWKEQSAGYGMKDKTGGTSGITSVKLKGGDRTSIALKGAGPALDLPLPLAPSSNVTAQWVSAVPERCFESVFPVPAVSDDAERFEDSIP